MRRVWLGCLLSVVLVVGGGVVRAQESIQLLVEKAEEGNAFFQFLLGGMYANGEGVRQDYAKAADWFKKAAAQGDAKAQFNLGRMYADGRGVRQDYAQSVAWYEKAAAQGVAEAQFNLGVMYELGQGIRQNKSTAKEWFGKACDNGDQDGCAAYRQLNEAGY